MTKLIPLALIAGLFLASCDCLTSLCGDCSEEAACCGECSEETTEAPATD
jgi:hypothetical protein